MKKKFWLTPPEIYKKLDEEFHFDHDPCPYPKPEGYDSLTTEWGQSNFVNPPFRASDGVDGKGATAFAHKAIEEQKKGKTSVLLLPVRLYVNLLGNAGAELRGFGRVQWLEAETKELCKNGSAVCCFILKGRKP